MYMAATAQDDARQTFQLSYHVDHILQQGDASGCAACIAADMAALGIAESMRATLVYHLAITAMNALEIPVVFIIELDGEQPPRPVVLGSESFVQDAAMNWYDISVIVGDGALAHEWVQMRRRNGYSHDH